jgi:hypothetical protein
MREMIFFKIGFLRITLGWYRNEAPTIFSLCIGEFYSDGFVTVLDIKIAKLCFHIGRGDDETVKYYYLSPKIDNEENLQ